MTEYGSMDIICSEYKRQLIILGEFILFNSDVNRRLKNNKLDLLREWLIDHIEECDMCKPSKPIERTKRKDREFTIKLAKGRAVSKNLFPAGKKRDREN
jgi:hypothetical protein